MLCQERNSAMQRTLFDGMQCTTAGVGTRTHGGGGAGMRLNVVVAGRADRPVSGSASVHLWPPPTRECSGGAFTAGLGLCGAPSAVQPIWLLLGFNDDDIEDAFSSPCGGFSSPCGGPPCLEPVRPDPIFWGVA